MFEWIKALFSAVTKACNTVEAVVDVVHINVVTVGKVSQQIQDDVLRDLKLEATNDLSLPPATTTTTESTDSK